ncbi:quinol:cytochrome C oxidoreductase [Bacteroidota bacterium]
MEERLKLSSRFYIGTFILIAIGVAAFITGFIADPTRAWANYLLNNVYFVSLSVGAVLFLSLQRVTHSGWSAGFLRVPEAMGTYLVVGGILFLVMIFGIQSLYHWSHADAIAHDPLIQHKTPYLNVPFWVGRMIVFFGLWILLASMLRTYSLREDAEGGLEIFKKAEHTGKIFIFVIAITFSFAGFDWIMSIDPHWYSALFALKNFVSAFYHAAAIITFIVLLLNQWGYFPFMTKSHTHDFSSYIFMLCIIWGYFWFAEFMIIWYGNIPEETSYFITRMQSEEWRLFFFANLIINWFIPFIIMMPAKSRKSKVTLKIIIPVLLIGMFLDLYLQIFPGVVGERVLGFNEIGGFIGFAGLFILVVAYTLTKANLYPKNHPFMEECLDHHV